MTFDREHLLDLLPAIYRSRPLVGPESDSGAALRGLLSAVAGQLAVVEADIAQLYDDQFVETCAPWVLPYLGDLLGIVGLPPEPLAPRAEVAHTISYRRRKGTATMVEQLARDVSGLPARAIEYFQIVGDMQYLNHLRPENQATLSLHDALRLEQIGGAFEHLSGSTDITHTVDVRKVSDSPRAGRYNLPNIGVFLWRIRAASLTRSPLVPADAGATRFYLSPVGIDGALFHRPRTEASGTVLAGPDNVPAPLSRRAFRARIEAEYPWSVRLERPATGGGSPAEVAVADVVAADLSGWTMPTGARVAIDPVLGRIAFADAQAQTPLGTYHYGSAGDIGGGEYSRAGPGASPALAVVRVAKQGQPFDSVASAVAALGPTGGVVEIMDSSRYEGESLRLTATGRSLVVRARDGSRPTIVLKSAAADADANVLSGDPDGSITLDGLLIIGRTLNVRPRSSGQPGPGRVSIRHCTLIPGTGYLVGAFSPLRGVSVSVLASGTTLALEACISGGLEVSLDASAEISDSIVDATAPGRVAYAGSGADFGGRLRAESCTIVGRVKADALERISNSIILAELAASDPDWDGPVMARRRQQGCIRFSYLPPGAIAPRRYRCQPAAGSTPDAAAPAFTSLHYGDPGFGQLAASCSPLISRGAADEGEMGAFHAQALPLRLAHLRARLAEYVRFGLEAGVTYGS